MNSGRQLCLFTLDEHRHALSLACVERVVFVVDITPLPKAPSNVLGIINVKGDIIPVYNPRQRFYLTERDIHLTDQLLIARTSQRTIALLVDSVDAVVEVAEEEIAEAKTITLQSEYIQGVIKLRDGLVLIHDLELFFSTEEERTLTEALQSAVKPQDCSMNDD
jgi:purine-binding chemotaxis protein CheW